MSKVTDAFLTQWAIAQSSGALLPCPRCGKFTMAERMIENSLSRRFNIHICAKCGMEEALEDMMGAEYPDYPKWSSGNWFVVRIVFGMPDSPFRQTNGKWQVSAMKTIEVSPEDIDDILCNAFEGGTTASWCYVEPDGELLGDYASEQISRGGALILREEETSDAHILTLEKMLKGIRLWMEHGNPCCYDGNDGLVLDLTDVDSDIADMIVQYAIFDEVVYS